MQRETKFRAWDKDSCDDNACRMCGHRDCTGGCYYDWLDSTIEND